LTVLKSIVVCLALANIGCFLWLHGIGQSQAVPVSSSSGVTLRLASEMPAPPAVGAAESGAATGATGEGSANGAAAGEAGGPGSPASAARCVSVGPFKDVSAAARAASTLRGGGYDPRQRVVDGDVWAGVWVYLPLPATHPASDQMLAKLRTAGIDDSLLMPGPGEGSVISLGLFSDQKRAQARVAEVQALGLTPGVADRRHTASLYWIDIDLKPKDGAFNPADLQGESGRINRLEVKACSAAAPQGASAASPAAAS
jgi:hypothetical protein